MPAAMLAFAKYTGFDVTICSTYCEDTSTRNEVISWKTERWRTSGFQEDTHLPFLKCYITHPNSFNTILEDTVYLRRRSEPQLSGATL